MRHSISSRHTPLPGEYDYIGSNLLDDSCYPTPTKLTFDNATGKVTGAVGLEVDGYFYDVRFTDGSCYSEFNECNVDNFQPRLVLATLFNKIVDELHNVNLAQKPFRITGCVDSDLCQIYSPDRDFTPTPVQGPSFSLFSDNDPQFVVDEDTNFKILSIYTDFITFSNTTWAVFTKQP